MNRTCDEQYCRIVTAMNNTHKLPRSTVPMNGNWFLSLFFFFVGEGAWGRKKRRRMRKKKEEVREDTSGGCA